MLVEDVDAQLPEKRVMLYVREALAGALVVRNPIALVYFALRN